MGNAESRPHGVGQILYMAHRVVVLGDGHGDALDISLLKGILAQHGRAHIARKRHHGHTVHIGGGNARYQIGSARAAGGQHHTGFAGGAGVSVGRMAGALLVGRHHMVDAMLVAVQFIIQIQHRAAGIAEQCVHALLCQHLHKYLRAIQDHGNFDLLLLCSLHSALIVKPRPCTAR